MTVRTKTFGLRVLASVHRDAALVAQSKGHKNKGMLLLEMSIRAIQAEAARLRAGRKSA